MSCSLFAIIQLGVTAFGIVAAFWLRNRQLKKHLSAMETTHEEAGVAFEEAKTKLESIEDRKEWLKSRIAALDGDDPVTVVQRMVLQNESKPKKSFDTQLTDQLSSGSDLEETWRELRTGQHEIATGLIASVPSQHSSIIKLYEVFSPLDQNFSLDLPGLPEPAEGSGDLSGDDHLQSENEKLKEELKSTRESLLTGNNGEAIAAAEGEDLKGCYNNLLATAET